MAVGKLHTVYCLIVVHAVGIFFLQKFLSCVIFAGQQGEVMMRIICRRTLKDLKLRKISSLPYKI